MFFCLFLMHFIISLLRVPETHHEFISNFLAHIICIIFHNEYYFSRFYYLYYYFQKKKY